MQHLLQPGQVLHSQRLKFKTDEFKISFLNHELFTGDIAMKHHKMYPVAVPGYHYL